MRTDPLQHLPDTINTNWKVGIVASSFYKEEVDALIGAAQSTLLGAGLSENNVQTHWAAGSFEIPLIGSALAESAHVDALIGLGIIIEGETEHARLLAEQTARGVMDVQLKYAMPFAFEILYVKNLQLARERASGEQNKGKEAAHAVLHSLAKLHSIRS
jgi:6,7-dimethyl-8-ribityllumazine synthase|tara:strand:+ start:81 stop:557 length:477 start_codon:yes stop_codon:yes gene_type:complete